MREGKVWVIGADGTGERALTDTLFYKTGRPITWTSDGRRVLFWNHSKVGWDIWAVTADGKEAANLTQVQRGGCRSPACSPDGKWTLGLISLDGADEVRLTKGPGEAWAPAWAPDGTRIAYLAPRDGKVELRVVTADQKTDTLLASVEGRWWHDAPSWSPDGKWLAFGAGPPSKQVVSIVDGKGRDLRKLATGRAYYPAWRPIPKEIGEILSGPAVVGLLWFARMRGLLRKEWLAKE
jgi:Tol biopolymer transport system component